MVDGCLRNGEMLALASAPHLQPGTVFWDFFTRPVPGRGRCRNSL